MKCSICQKEGHRSNNKKFHLKSEVVDGIKTTPVKSQSDGLSKRLTQLVEEGRHLNDDSCSSEGILSEAMCEIIPYAKEHFKPLGYTIVLEKTISLFDCQSFFEKVGGPKPNPDNKKVCMRPDGGILFAVSGERRIPILIVEDKVQGTNDNLFEQKKLFK